MKNDGISGMLSIAAKAGKIVSGAFSVEKAIKSGSAFLVILAEDASANTKKSFKDSGKYYEVPVYEYGDSDRLGHNVGCGFRKVLAVTDEGFAKSLIDKLEKLKDLEVNG